MRVLILLIGIGAVGLLLRNPLAAAEGEACIKYHKCVSLAQFKCTDTSSSLVKRVCYNEPRQYMIIKLQATDYHYCGIPPRIVEELLAAASLGRYYNQNIKSAATNRAYDCRDHPIPQF